MPALASNIKCTGCMLCGDICPHSAISFRRDDANYHPVIDKTKCVECKLCEKNCPEITPELPLKNKELLSPIAGWISDKNIRKNSASGGAFIAVALAFIKDSERRNVKWNIVGSILEDNSSRMKMITNVGELALLQGTKYSSTVTKDIYTKTFHALKNGEDVLFSGLPCHINALLVYLKNRSYGGRLLTCDLICNGVPNNKLLKLTSDKVSKIVSYRDKEDGWGHITALKYINNDGELCRETLADNYFLKALCNNFLMRESCYDCRYCTLYRNSDMTIGDWWGCSLSAEQSRDGVSLIIPHSRKALEIVKDSGFQMYDIDWHECLPYNPRIFTGKRFIGSLIPGFLKNKIETLGDRTIYRLLTCDFSAKKTLNPFWIYYKLKYKVLSRMDNKFRKNALDSTMAVIKKSNSNEDR